MPQPTPATPRSHHAGPTPADKRLDQGHYTPAAAVVDATLSEQREALQALFPIPPARRSKRKAAGIGTVALAALAACLWWANPSYRSEQWSAATGAPKRVALADGSALVLDTDSAVQIEWRLRSRELQLTRGRVHVDAQPSRWRPLLVDAGTTQVRVVGTRFDVWRMPAQTEVRVQQGVVSVSDQRWSAAPGFVAKTVLAGQSLAIPREAGVGADVWRDLRVTSSDQPAADAWQTGQWVFEQTPLLDVLAQIQRYRSTPIVIVGRARGVLPVSGVFRISDSDALLAHLAQILPIQVQQTDGGAVQVRLQPTGH